MINVVLLGCGNVASQLYDAFSAPSNAAVKVVQVYGRSAKKLLPFQQKTPVTTDLQQLTEADLYLIAVSDEAVISVSDRIPGEGKLIAHTSGTVTMHAMNKLHHRGVFYPLQTFTKGVSLDFETIPLCLEAENEENYILMDKIAQSISSHVIPLKADKRRHLHMAAVFANNFTNQLYRMAHEICEEHRLEFDLLRPLILETAQKVQRTSPFVAQTGPAKRGDVKTIEKHLELLSTKEQKEIYTLLTHRIAKIYGKEL
ncbi:DUF2520 domain-containing protein [Gangjinia marincola]|uniref:DUF2520 domain-containing protein n=1 Tax=Gangjinia marincola TaxID=578463 RepID=A0ABN1MCV1_9FLAO